MDSIEANVVYEPYQYAAQNEVELSRNPKKITSVTSGDYFEKYQNGKYHPRPWLKQIYPRDWNNSYVISQVTTTMYLFLKCI